MTPPDNHQFYIILIFNFPFFIIQHIQKVIIVLDVNAKKVLIIERNLDDNYWDICNGFTLLNTGNKVKSANVPKNVNVDVPQFPELLGLFLQLDLGE